MPKHNLESHHQFQAHALRLLLRPVMRYCLRRSLKIQEVVEACKAALIDAAEDEIEQRGARRSVARLSVMTGVHRSDVARITGESESANTDGEPKRLSGNIINRLIAQWQTDRRFLTSAGKPRLLSFDGKTGEFARLIQSVSSDPNPYAVLSELERIGAVERTRHGLRLTTPEFIVRTDPGRTIEHVAQDSDDLLAAVEENLGANGQPVNLHLRTEYDRIGVSSVPQIRKWLLKEGSAFHARLRRYLSQFDLDVRPRKNDPGVYARVSLCSFSRVEDHSPELTEEDESQ